MIEKATLLSAFEHNQEALASLRQASKLDPQNAFIPYVEGEIYRKSGQHQAALAAFDTALKYQPNLVEACVGKGIVLAHHKI